MKKPGKMVPIVRLVTAWILAMGAAGAVAGQSVSQSYYLDTGWNLSGNGLNKAIAVEQLFGSQSAPVAGVSDQVTSVWQWDSANSKWKFFAPSLSAADLAAHAQSKGYAVLSEIGPGTGFWVNAKAPVTLPGAQTGAPAMMTADDLPPAWSLNAVYAATTPRQLNISSSFMPPQPGVKVVSFVTLWAWDNANANWYFYAPSLDDGAVTLSAYIQSKGYQDFDASTATNPTGKKLRAGVGFWINKAGALKEAPPEIFPTGMAVAAPTAAAEDTASGAKTKLDQDAGKIRDILTESAELANSFNAGRLLEGGMFVDCFGPTMQYTSHPDAGGPTSGFSPNGQFPSGDLGIWKATASDPAGRTQACAAATLEGRMHSVSARTNMALTVLAGLLVEAKKAGKLPQKGTSSTLTSELNALKLTASMVAPSAPGAPPPTQPVSNPVTFSAATLSLDSSGDVWTYSLAFSFADAQGKSHNAAIDLTHLGAVADPISKYRGVMKWLVTDVNNGGSYCTGDLTQNSTEAFDVTHLGSLSYDRTNSANLATIMRSGTYCGKLDASTAAAHYATDGQLDPNSNWSDNFSRFGAKYNPLTLDGYYGYGWQAGYRDGHARIFSVSINGDTKDGEAWYGYGDDLHTSDGTITGFYCDWAGPGIKTYQTYAQRQAIKLSATTGLWDATASNIRYAPTNACTYTGSGFWYDRNLNGAKDETPADVTVSGTEADFLYPKGTSDVSIADTIRARGMIFPAF